MGKRGVTAAGRAFWRHQTGAGTRDRTRTMLRGATSGTARSCNSLDDASASRPVPNALLALNRMPRHAMLPECIAMCACHTFLRCFVDACFVMPISADYAGGAARCHAARGPTLRPQPRIRGGSSRDCKRGRGGMGGVVPKRCQFCLLHVVCSTCVGRPLQASRVSL